MENNTEKNQRGNAAPQNDWAKIKEWLVRHNKPIIIAAALILLDSYFFNVFIGEVKPTLANIVTLLISVVTLYFFYLRIKNQDRQLEKQTQQINIQIRKEIDDRFNAAINLLGSNETSARTGAIFSLYQLAIENKKYRKQVSQILCSHIRSKTQEKEYQQEHAINPSNEIQTTINLLFKDNKTIGDGKRNNIEGLYAHRHFRTELPSADLSLAYLSGADFSQSNCQLVNFLNANCAGAQFYESFCEQAIFAYANCQCADFRYSTCQGTNFSYAECQGANFRAAQCQGVLFQETHCEAANFRGMNCQGGNFYFSCCQGADFSHAECEGAFASIFFAGIANRIGKNTQFETIVFSGEFKKDSIDQIEKSKNLMTEEWYEHMQNLIKENENEPISNEMPEFNSIKLGVLTNSKELQKIIQHINKLISRTL